MMSKVLPPSWPLRFLTFSRTNAAGRWKSRMSAIEKKRLPCFTSSKPCFAAEAQLLGDTRDAEGLAGEAGAKDVVRRDVGDRDGVDVAVRALAEIRLVGLLAELVVVRGEDTRRRPHVSKAMRKPPIPQKRSMNRMRWVALYCADSSAMRMAESLRRRAIRRPPSVR